MKSLFLSVLSLVLCPAIQAQDPGSPSVAGPNVVVILLDDLDLPTMTDAIDGGLLPTIRDELVFKGTTFRESFVTNSLCTPARATLLTGQYSHNHGVRTNRTPKGGVTNFEDTSTLATWLQSSGYRTGFMGKYLHQYGQDKRPLDPRDDPDYIPPGWDDFIGLLWPGASLQYEYAVNDNGSYVSYGSMPDDYQTDMFADAAVDFIDSSVGPFFLMLAPTAPHTEDSALFLGSCRTMGMRLVPIRPADRHEGIADDIPMPQFPNFNPPHLDGKPSWHVATFWEPLRSSTIDCMEDVYQSRLESMAAIDDMVRGIIDALRANNQLNNTLIIFTSDNGYLFGDHRAVGKQFQYDRTIQVPLIVRAPGNGPGRQICDKMVINNDIAPTICDFTGVEPGHEVDGRSFRTLLSVPDWPGWSRKQFLVDHTQQQSPMPTYNALRTSITHPEVPDSLYVAFYHGEWEYYNMVTDQFQRRNRIQDVTPNNRRKLDLVMDRLYIAKGEECALWEDYYE